MINNNTDIAWYDARHPASLQPLTGLNSVQQDWLLDQGSLTQRLRASTQGHIQHHLCFSGWGNLLADEVSLFSQQDDASVWVREIEWRLEDSVWVAARVVIPRRCCTRELLNLGERSLGEVLFADKSLKRSSLELACLSAQHPYHQLAFRAAPASDIVWARRSIFHFQQQPLLVAEIFLPPIFQQG